MCVVSIGKLPDGQIFRPFESSIRITMNKISDRFTFRPARTGDFDELQRIERSAGQLFRTFGMDEIADHEPTSIADFEDGRAAGLLWIAASSERVVGFALADTIDGNLHLDELAVDPRFARQGLGSALVETVCHAARAHACSWVTLRTFAEVPWNGPFYTKLGFRELPEHDVTPSLRQLASRETAAGLDVSPRIFMRRKP